MCVTRINTPAIASNIESLSDARDIARKNKGTEVIVKDNNGNYSVHQLNPKDVDNIVNTRGGNIDPKGIEFVVEKSDGKNAVLINKNAGIFDKARSELVTGKENLLNLGHKVEEKYEEVKESIIDNAEKLFGNLNKKTAQNKYVRGGETVDINKGIVQADCSGFVLNMFKKAGMDLTTTDMTAADIGKYIRDGKGFLQQTTKASQVKPTDVITFDKDKNDKSWYTGHVMVAVNTPKPIYDKKDSTKIIGYNVDIMDSTSVGHGNDTRTKGESGAGLGTISFSVDKNGNIASFYWGKDFSGKQHANNVTVGTIKP